MFYKYRWLEFAYCMSANLVVLAWCAVLFHHLLRMSSHEQLILQKLFWPWGMVVLIGIMFFLLVIFPFALLSTAGVSCALFGKPKTAERIYKLSLTLRSSLPIVGKTARVDFWNLSLANCFRDQGRSEEAEELYKAVLARQEKLQGVERWSNYGLTDAALENYAPLLRAVGRIPEAIELERRTGKSIRLLRAKYAIASLVILVGGLLFALWTNAQLHALVKLVEKMSK